MCRPRHIEIIGSSLAIVWENNDESIISLIDLRKACPCAYCKGDVGVFSPLRLPASNSSNESNKFEVYKLESIGHYAIRFHWSDGHNAGIYPFVLLKQINDIK